MPAPGEQEWDDIEGVPTAVLTSSSDPIVADAPTAMELVIVGDGIFITHELAPNTMLTVGRSATCDVAVDHHTISRRHAILRASTSVTIEDLGSANGTLVRGERLEAQKEVVIAVGELVKIGAVSLLLQTSSRARATPTRRAWTHEQFEQRVREECARCARTGGAFAVVRIYVETQAPANFVEQTILGVLREADVVGRVSPNVFEVMLDCDPARADDAVMRIHHKLLEAQLKARLLTACFPRDGGAPSQLFERIDLARARRSASVTPVVADPHMQNLHRLLHQVAGSKIGVLLLGETGVGKEVFARMVHASSPRARGPFIEINCAALTESLLESELFGHEKGAFTSATSSKAGLIEAADGGTLLLDEIGDMPLATQVKLLRVIEDSQLRRVGALRSKPVDVRFVAATNSNLEERVAQGTFRSDLLFRLNGIAIVIPPLRERLADLEPLAREFLRQAAGPGVVPALSQEALAWMRAHHWPGNVRELKHTMERAVLLAAGKPIGVEHLSFGQMLAQRSATTTPPHAVPRVTAAPRKGSDEERAWIVEALERAGGNQTLAAQYLGISRRTLVSRLADYDIDRPRKPKPDA